MQAIVFSRDRPMQLDLLLTSLERNAPRVFDVSVILSASKEFEQGYARCEREHPEAAFIPEDSLTYQVRSLCLGPELVTFFTDDDVLYRPLGEIPELHEEWLCFSLRLGANTTFCYPLERHQTPPAWSRSSEGTLAWEWEGFAGGGDFGYPMSLDGHIFRGQDLLPILQARHFSNPNWLEEVLMRDAKTIGRPLMASFYTSCLVGLPLNRVNETTPNRHGQTHPYMVFELNERYLKGQRIDLDALDFSSIYGAHQEIPLVFR